jgi:uncharacterized protein YecT (DUF1311 family)
MMFYDKLDLSYFLITRRDFSYGQSKSFSGTWNLSPCPREMIGDEKMKKSNIFIVVALLVGMSACSNSSEDAASIVKKVPTDTTNQIKENDNLQGENTTKAVTKIKGSKNAYLERLDNIQKELDALPEKKDSDKGVTNAMKNYYGISYEKYDEELNEIYALLKKELSPEVMSDLKTEQIKWIEQKEKKADDERLKYNGGTFEHVAMYISLYESTKERCYELVNTYMTDEWD